MTLAIVPYYGEPAGRGNPEWHYRSSTIITYELYVDGTRKGAYPYQLSEKMFRWILAPLAIPFLFNEWEIHTPFSEPELFLEALTSTARLFLRDAQREGYL
jgi:hypothetical protein